MTLAQRARLLLVAALWCGAARAQTDRELATRQELIARAVERSNAGQHAEALDLAKRAAAIKPSTSLRMFLAQEENALGSLADAYGNAKQCAVEADADPQLHDRERIAAACKELEASLTKRVGRVTVALTSPRPPDVEVKIGGERVSPALLGAPYVVSPGKLVVELSAPGYQPFRAEIDVGEGAAPVVNVNLTVAIAPTATTDAPPPAVPAADVAARPEATERDWRGPALLGGAGLVVGAVATVIWFQGDAKYGDLKSQCNGPGGCSTPAYDDARSAIRRDDALGVGGWVIGAAAMAGAAIWYFVRAPNAGRPAIAVDADPRGVVRVGGRF